jgi:hypothetical protein
VRITNNTTIQSFHQQLCQLFELPEMCKLSVYDLADTPNSSPTANGTHEACDLIAISIQDLVTGVLDYFKNGMDAAYLATTGPKVVIEASVPTGVVHDDVAQHHTGAMQPKMGARVKPSRVYKPKAYTRRLDSLWPLCIPRYHFWVPPAVTMPEYHLL